ncbi:hypothetical protein Ctob_009875 [Chrysochromulina tobinii]|uniref:Nucleoporin Nup54 alpha-helical domain-containing protein n=1 Tax=Chrysochromulina tobinii TaxID=1460289 RepID=A0A0M0LQM4_9EUKA|nr:hypothetical protein Ctob_009875 [Chrysochromulina tobinii]|eukprot:KOO53344.1 hypothetical protein Ctob_009875 [Chrysochromulina sp. CCMP291]
MTGGACRVSSNIFSDGVNVPHRMGTLTSAVYGNISLRVRASSEVRRRLPPASSEARLLLLAAASSEVRRLLLVAASSEAHLRQPPASSEAHRLLLAAASSEVRRLLLVAASSEVRRLRLAAASSEAHRLLLAAASSEAHRLLLAAASSEAHRLLLAVASSEVTGFEELHERRRNQLKMANDIAEFNKKALAIIHTVKDERSLQIDLRFRHYVERQQMLAHRVLKLHAAIERQHINRNERYRHDGGLEPPIEIKEENDIRRLYALEHELRRPISRLHELSSRLEQEAGRDSPARWPSAGLPLTS